MVAAVRERTYLDFNATAPLSPAARAAMIAALDVVGNPSSVHAEGRRARALIEEARGEVARLVGGDKKNVVFTSGGTEAANLALTPHVSAAGIASGIGRLLLCAVEHACVLKGHRFPAERVTILPVDAEGRLDLDALAGALAGSPQRAMLALQLANNETGVLQPVQEAAALVHEHGGLLVCDAVQAIGKVPLDINDLGADMLIVSAHKFGGPKGVGALVFSSDRIHIEDRMLRGGGQERGLRAGTPGVAAIAGFGAACGSLQDITDEFVRVAALREQIEREVRAAAPEAVIFGSTARRLANTSAFAVPGLSSETLLIGLDLAGVAVSSGAACSSGKVGRSHVLDAMGVASALARGAIRVSLGWSSTARDVEHFGEALAGVVGQTQERRGVAA